ESGLLRIRFLVDLNKKMARFLCKMHHWPPRGHPTRRRPSPAGALSGIDPPGGAAGEFWGGGRGHAAAPWNPVAGVGGPREAGGGDWVGAKGVGGRVADARCAV